MTPPSYAGHNNEKSRSRDRLHSPSRLSPGTLPSPGFLDNDATKVLTSTASQYNQLLEKMNSTQIPDPKSLKSLINHLRKFSQWVDERDSACNAGLRDIAKGKRELFEGHANDSQSRTSLAKDRDEPPKEYPSDPLETSEHAGSSGTKLGKRKTRDDRPLPPDTYDLPSSNDAPEPARHTVETERTSLPAENSITVPSKKEEQDGGVVDDARSNASDESSQSQQLEAEPPIAQFHVFGDNPLMFDDPTVYRITKITSDMTDEEKKSIFSVSHFPSDPLRYAVTGDLPNKDFSNSKPPNQVNFNTFLSYIEPYVRNLEEKDIPFLAEKGDRTSPFLLPRRGTKHYTEVWSEQDGNSEHDGAKNQNKSLSLNQGKGATGESIDGRPETDQFSAVPLMRRLQSLLRLENHHKSDNKDNHSSSKEGGNIKAGETGTANGQAQDDTSATKNPVLGSATTLSGSVANNLRDLTNLKLEPAQLDERIKTELRYVGFIGNEDVPDYDAHYDDEVAERLRSLQSELKTQLIVNSARKRRLLEVARERLAYQEYYTIHNDLDAQLQNAFLKRSRTLGKPKKPGAHKYRPGASGNAGSVSGQGVGVSRPGIGDTTRALMDRRRRWSKSIGPIFQSEKFSVPPKGETLWDRGIMKTLEEAELQSWDEEQD